MNITLYNSSAEPNKLDKSGYLTQLASYSGAVARVNVSLMNPTLILEESISNIKNANYCYIADFGRYYYIKEKTCDANGIYTLSLAVDVLMSFKNSILNQSGIVSRQANVYNMYLPGSVPCETRPLVTTVKMTQISTGGFSTQSAYYVLLAVGGK